MTGAGPHAAGAGMPRPMVPATPQSAVTPVPRAAGAGMGPAVRAGDAARHGAGAVRGTVPAVARVASSKTSPRTGGGGPR